MKDGDQNPAAEVERLRTLLERQPACLMRVGTDGTLHAVSDAALSLLGASNLAQVLGTSLIERITGDARRVWSDFVLRVSQGGSASVECEMTDLAASRRSVIVQGVSAPPHPDGGESLLVTVRDVSTIRRLEESLHQQGLQAQARLGEVTAERQQLAAALNELKDALNTAIGATMLAEQLLTKTGHK